MNHKKGFIVLSVLALVVTSAFLSSLAQSITWSVNIKRMTEYTYVDTYPALMQTKDYKIWFVWSREIMGNLTLWYKTSPNLGYSWSSENNLTNLLVPGQAQNPSIMQAADGTIWLAWASDAPPPPAPNFYMTADPQKLTIPQDSADSSNITVTSIYGFSETLTLSVVETPESVNAILNPRQVTPPPNGKINSTLTLSVDPTAVPGNYTLTVTAKGTTQTHSIGIDLEITAMVGGATQQSTANEYTYSTQLPELDPFFDDYEIHLKKSHDNGASWTSDTWITYNDVDDMHPSIIQLQNGTIMLVWQTRISNNSEICYKTFNGTAWSETVQLTTDPDHDFTPTVTQTKSGHIWVVWASDRYGDYEIFYKIFNGSAWSSDTRLTTNIAYDIQPTIIQAMSEDVYVFWSSNTSGTYDIYYSYYNGTIWAANTPLVAGSYEDVWTAVMRARDTKIWVAYATDEVDQPDGNWEIFIKSSLAGDVNGDGITNIADLTIVSLVYGATPSKPNYNPNADLNRDGIVDIRDLGIIGYYLLET